MLAKLAVSCFEISFSFSSPNTVTAAIKKTCGTLRPKMKATGGRFYDCEAGVVVRMVVDSLLPHAKFEPNDHRKNAPPFISHRKPKRLALA